MGKAAYSIMVCLVVLLAYAMAGYGDIEGSLTAEEILQKMEEVSNRIQDAKVTIREFDASDKLTRTEIGISKKPDKGRSEATYLLAGMERTVITVSDGEKNWSYTPAEQVGRYFEVKSIGVMGSVIDPLSSFSTAETLDKYEVEFKGTEDLDGRTIYILHLIPKPGTNADLPYSDSYNVEMSLPSTYSPERSAVYAVWTDSGSKEAMGYTRLGVDANSFIVLLSENHYSVRVTPQRMEVTKTGEFAGGIIFPTEVVSYDPSGEFSMRTTYTDVQFNTGIPDEQLVFAPPAEAIMLDKEAFSKLYETIAEYEEKAKAEPDNPALRYALLTLYQSVPPQQNRKVLEHLEKLVELDSDAAELYSRLGNVYLDANRPEDALVACQKALELNPDLELGQSLARAYDRTGQKEKAVEQYKLALEAETPGYQSFSIGQSSQPIRRLVQIYQDMGKLDELIVEYQAKLDEYPDNARFHELIIEAYTALQDREETVAGYRKLIQMMTDKVSPYGQVDHSFKRRLHALGMYHELAPFYEKMLETPPGPGYQIHYACQELVTIYTQKKDLQKLLPTYEKHMEYNPRSAGQSLPYSIREIITEADLEELIQKAQQQTPERATLYMLLGSMHLSEPYLVGRQYSGSSRQHPGFARAISMYERAAELAPDDPVVQLAIAKLHVQRAYYDEALKSYQQALELDPEQQYYRAQMAYVYNRMRDHPKAIEIGKNMVQERPDEMASHGVLATVYYNAITYEEAIPEYKKAIELAGEGYQSSVRFFRKCMAQTYEDTADYAKADAIYEELGQWSNGHEIARIYTARGDMNQIISYVLKSVKTSSGRHLVDPLINELSNGNMLGELTTALEEELKSQPDNPEIYRTLARAYSNYQARNPQKAIQMYEKVMELEPADSNVYSSLGNLYSGEKMHDKAIAAYEKAMELGTERAYLYASLARIYANAGRKEDALKQADILKQRAGYDSNAYSQLGEIYSLCELHDEAIEAFKKAIELSPERAQYIQRKLASAYEAAGKTEEADAIYENTQDPNMMYERIRIYQRRGDLEKLMELARKIMKSDTQVGYMSSAQRQVVQAFQQQGKLDDLIAVLQKDAEESLEDPTPYKMLAQVYSRQEDRDKAIEMYEKVIELTPDDGNAYIELGQLYNRQGMQDDALSAYEKAIELGTDSLHTYAQLARIYSRVGRTDDAIALADDLKERCNDGNSYFSLGQVYMAVQYYDEAIEAYKKAVKLSPRQSYYKTELARAYERAGREEEAEELYEKSTDPDMLNQRMRTYRQQGDLEKLLKIANQLMSSPGAQSWHKRNAMQELVNGYSRQGGLDELVTVFQKQLTEKPKNPDSYANLGLIYMRQQDHAKAIEMYEKAAALAPDDYQTQGNLGQLYLQEGMYQKAASSYRKALDAQPGLTNFYLQLAQAYIGLGEDDEAIKLADELKKLMKDSRYGGNQAYMNSTLGEIYAAVERYDEAIEAYKQAIKMEPGNESYWGQKLLEIYEKAGKDEEADELRERVQMPRVVRRPDQPARRRAPKFSLQTPDGETVNLADFKGKAVILNFWAPWVPACMKEMSALEKIHQAHKDELVVVGVSVDPDSADAVRSHLEKRKITYTIVIATQEMLDYLDLALEEPIETVPSTIILDKSGNISGQRPGPQTEANIRAFLAGKSLISVK